MKKLIVLFVFCFGILSIGANAQLKVNSSGYVGINQSNPLYNLDWSGNGRFKGSSGDSFIFDTNYLGVPVIYPDTDGSGSLGYINGFESIYGHVVTAYYFATLSDETVKENIVNLGSTLDKIVQLRGVRYDLKSELFKTANEKIKASQIAEGKDQIGFLAQELKDIFPELVRYDSLRNQYGVMYDRMVPILVEAMKEQQSQIDALKNQVAAIEVNCCNSSLKSASIATGTTTDLAENKVQLDQNIPNPFSKETKIGCFVPEGSGASVLYIYNMNGTQLQQYSINGKGKQTVTINGNSFQPGMYLYALVIDGTEVDTKRMILTK